MRFWRAFVPIVAGSLPLVFACTSFHSADEPALEAGAPDEASVPDVADRVMPSEDASSDLLWLTTFGAPGGKLATLNLAVSPTEAVIVAGSFSGLGYDFGGGVVQNQDPTTLDAFVTTLEGATGKHSRTTSVSGAGAQFARGVAVSSVGKFVYGSFGFDQSITFDAQLTASNPGAYSAALARFSGQGGMALAPIALAAGGGGSNVQTSAVSGIATEGAVMLGSFTGDVNLLGVDEKMLGPGTGIWLLRTYDLDQHVAFCKGGDCFASGLAVTSADDMVVAGRATGFVGLGPSESQSMDPDLFVASFDGSLGAPRWVKKIIAPSRQEATVVAAVPASRDVVVAGIFQGTVDFGTGPKTAMGEDVFVVAYDEVGATKWVYTGGGGAIDRPAGIVVDKSGRTYVAGNTTSAMVDFGTGPLVNHGNGNGKMDVFVLTLDLQGKPVESRLFGGELDDVVGGLGLDGAGDLVLAASFSGTIDVAGTSRTAVGDVDVFVAKLRRH